MDGFISHLSCAIAALVGDDLARCSGELVTLDGSGSLGCAGSLEYRWLDGLLEPCGGWSPNPRCDVMPTATTTYTLEVRCDSCVSCEDSASQTVIIEPPMVPGDVGNTLRQKRTGNDVSFAWASATSARTYMLYRSETKGSWPAPIAGGLVGTTHQLADVAFPPSLYLYRVSGVNCAGVEGP